MIDFTAEQNARTYSGRRAHPSWAEHVRALVDPRGADVVDIGCGGGIYSRAWRDLGADSVIGVDASAPILTSAGEDHRDDPRISFQQGDALATGLPDASADVVFARALVHHLQDLQAFTREARRLLRPGGTLIIQDRTLDDVSQPPDVDLPGGARHLRGWFFQEFPSLLEVEAARRPEAVALRQALQNSGAQVETSTVWEVRAEHADREALIADLAARTGRSILHELDDAELARLVSVVRDNLPPGPVIETDRWTLWAARIPAADSQQLDPHASAGHE
ncbi:class I SAM-dependent methyltransferase [Nesterenkonia sp. HG001]|uniref:class I SAM-dependent methyltransferase n=1 Tax=Nesterenkonia sp. HG001 TaxID=2983207 RepID=UPI002AC4DEE1|nr:class I SAM-dependent methyltransferase [Nesterenkonia sp. HG001]MDZ5076799.1 class I SAM-dependent methyltransferase [Nesterenkonia sp. HG001]